MVTHSRAAIARFIGADPDELVFTSGATEAINLAIKGVANRYVTKGKHIITWQTEHRAVLDVCEKLASKGFELTFLPVDREGLPDLNTFQSVLREDTILTIMMLANNETGVVNPVKEFSKLAHSKNCIFFCDATQAPGKMMVDVNDLGADLLCLSAHKMYGPKGTGALYVRRKNPRVTLEPLLEGGGHENGLRPGTLNVPGIVGFGKAAELCVERYWEDTSHISKLRTMLEQMLTYNGKGYVNGSIKNRLPNTSNILFPGLKAASLITKIPNIAVATGSACSSALPEPSHVLKAMGLSDEEAYSSVRFSIGRSTTQQDIEIAAQSIQQIL